MEPMQLKNCIRCTNWINCVLARSHDAACATNLSRMSSTLNIFPPKILKVTDVQNQERSKEPHSQMSRVGGAYFVSHGSIQLYHRWWSC